MPEPEQPLILDQSEVANLSQRDVQYVQAELVRMYQTDAEVVTADEVELRRSAVGNLKAGHVTARKSLLASVNATEFSAEKSITGYVQAETATVNGYTGVVAGTNVQADGARTFLLIGRNVTGNIVTLIDSRSALIAGLTAGLFGGLILLLGRILFGRK